MFVLFVAVLYCIYISTSIMLNNYWVVNNFVISVLQVGYFSLFKNTVAKYGFWNEFSLAQTTCNLISSQPVTGQSRSNFSSGPQPLSWLPSYRCIFIYVSSCQFLSYQHVSSTVTWLYYLFISRMPVFYGS